MKKYRFLFTILLIVSGLFTSNVKAQKYKVIDLGTFGGTYTVAFGINDAGQVVGRSALLGDTSHHAFLWQNGIMTDLGTLGGPYSYARGINNLGQVVGIASTPRTPVGEVLFHAIRWQNGTMTDLGTLGGPTSSANGINDSGQIVGEAYTIGGQEQHAFLWQNGTMTGLGTIGGSVSGAMGINNSGQVVGYSRTTDETADHAILWQNGTKTDLGTFGGLNSSANGINNHAQVVGSAQTSKGPSHAFLWQNGTKTDLYTQSNFAYSSATGINEQAQVVGSVYNTFVAGGSYAFLWENGVMTNLNTLIDTSLGWTLNDAYDINNLGQIVGSGTHNGQTRAFLLQTSTIISPNAGKLFIAGEQNTIKWSGGSAGRFLTIELSVNSGITYTNIDIGIPADSGFYVWNIPDSLLSNRAKIRLSDAADQSVLAESDTFRIKGYVLTKFASDGTYFNYSPDIDRWGFGNSSEDVWPSKWWFNKFNYRGTDPFTGDQYSQWQGNDVFKDAFSHDFPDWPSFVNTFSVNACYISTTLSIYSPTALARWAIERDLWGGSCFGFAISNAIAFRNKEDFRTKYTGYPDFDIPIEILSDTNTIPVINELYTHQFGEPHTTYRETVGLLKTPNQTLNELKAMLVSEDAPVQTLSILNNGAGGGGHAILAYKVQKDPTQESIYNVYVYDNANPDSVNAKIVIDTAAFSNKGGWTYSLLPGWGGKKWMFLRDPAISYLTNPTLPKIDPAGRKSPFILAGDVLEINLVRSASVRISDAGGNQTGYFDSLMQSDIPGSYPLVFENGSKTPPYGYSLSGGAYSISMSNFSQGSSRAFLFTGNKSFGFERAGATSSQTDQIFFDGSFSVANLDTAAKVVNLLNIVNETTREKVVSVRSLTLAHNDSVKMENIAGDGLKLSSFGSSSSMYNLELEFYADTGVGLYVHDLVQLEGNSSQFIQPNWIDLTGSDLNILIDKGNDGTIDDSLKLSNEVTDVDDRRPLLKPNEYSLAQNYPNPFNSTTTIRYVLPKASHVSLKVFNVLGQEIVTLVDGIQEAGYRSVGWNAREIPSGVYFYRLQADNVIMTKKLILMK